MGFLVQQFSEFLGDGAAELLFGLEQRAAQSPTPAQDCGFFFRQFDRSEHSGRILIRSPRERQQVNGFVFGALHRAVV
jgi:hypothetical protein